MRAQQCGDHLAKGGFAVLAAPVEEKQSMLGHHTHERVSNSALNERHKIFPPVQDLVQEGLELQALSQRVIGDGELFREQIITLGTAPMDEPCVQRGQDDYYDEVRRQCQRFIKLLRRTFGDEPPGARFSIKSFNHDFRLYYEVVCLFNTDDEEAAHYAFRFEEELPATWEG
jgi:hypothetical protein